MIIECKGCSKRFRLNATLLKPGGSRVRCSKCGAIFRVHPGETEATPLGQGARRVVEKRKFPRTPISIPTLCNSTGLDGRPEDVHIGSIREISRGGAAIDLFPAALSRVVTLSFIGVDNQDVQINGEVRHSRLTPSGKTRVGLSLMGAPDEISHFVAQALKIHHQSAAYVPQVPGGRGGERAPTT